MTTKELVERAHDPIALSILTSAGDALGIAVAALVKVLDPEAVILGGGLGSAASPMHDTLLRSYQHAGGSAPIRMASLGHRSGLVGAAALVWSAQG
jgi:glucokinase